MELSRSDFQILNVLKEHQCTNYQESMTLQEIIPELPFSRVTAYKRLKNLCDMQSIEEKIYEVFWDKNIARMINRADLFSFLKQYVNPGLLTRSSKSELVHDLKEYMTTIMP